MKAEEVKRLKGLEVENSRLKKLLAERVLDDRGLDMVKHIRLTAA